MDSEAGKIPLTENALRVLKRRYLARDESGRIVDTPEELFRRVARAVAAPEGEPEQAEEMFYHLMSNLYFLPNTPTLMNADRELGQLSACFVLPVEDSMESIFESVKQTALIHQSGGGTGFSFSRLRPKGSAVASTGGVSSGPVSFMKVFDTATDVIKQGGKRRGANMGILRVDHPDILDFIHAKDDPGQYNNFNISVALTNAFMQAVEDGTHYHLVDPHTGRVKGSLPSREVFDEIAPHAWKRGDPGVIFLDRIARDNPTPDLGSIEGTNPCGEQPLLPYESCNLGSINLSRMIRRGPGGNGRWVLDDHRLDRVVSESVRFLDNVIDVNRYPLPQIEEVTKGNWKIGLGVMGLADLLIKLEIPYNSTEALGTARHIMKRIQRKAWEASEGLARIRGPFPNFHLSDFSKRGMPPRRNATTTTIAPTGTLSIITGCSSGIEPLFAVSYVRKVLDQDELLEIHPLFVEIAKEKDSYQPSLMGEAARLGSIRDIGRIPEAVRRIFVTAHDITPEWHVRMQATFQAYTDNAVSKTVNFLHDATDKGVRRAYLLAYEEGCKGVTIYRDRSRKEQVLNLGSAAPVELVETSEQMASDEGFMVSSPLERDTSPRVRIAPRPRPVVTRGVTERIGTGCGRLYVTVNRDNEGICEVFAQVGKSGGCAASQIESIARLISLALRSRVSLAAVVKQMRGIRCPAPLWGKSGMVLSCADAIARVLEHYLGSGEVRREGGDGVIGSCPDCGGAVEHAEGCEVCRFCGCTKCS